VSALQLVLQLGASAVRVRNEQRLAMRDTLVFIVILSVIVRGDVRPSFFWNAAMTREARVAELSIG
jgi:hypothetical protein